MAIPTNKECDVCGEVKLCSLHYGNMWYCITCWTKEEESVKTHMSEEAQNARVDASNEYYRMRDEHLRGMQMSSPVEAAIPINSVLRESAAIDNNIQVRTDLFNAATKSIIELKDAILGDENITNKPYALAEALKNRFEHHKTVVFELNEKLIEEGNQQKAIQVYLNTLANTLRAEEREKLKIADINYKPAPPKIASKPRAASSTGTKKVKLDKISLRKAANELNISEFMLQSLVVSQNLTIEQAAEKIRKSIEAAKSS